MDNIDSKKKQYHSEYYVKNKAKRNQQSRDYYQKHKVRLTELKNKRIAELKRLGIYKERPTGQGWRAMVVNLLRERDGELCGICKKEMDFANTTKIHIDHIVPYHKTKDHSANNIQLTHAICNLRKDRKYSIDE